MDEAKSIKDGKEVPPPESTGRWDDPKYPIEDWKKCTHAHTHYDSFGNKTSVSEVHWWQHRSSGQTHGYKYKDIGR